MYRGNMYEFVDKFSNFLKDKLNLELEIFLYHNTIYEIHVVVLPARHRCAGYVTDSEDFEQQVINLVKTIIRRIGIKETI